MDRFANFLKETLPRKSVQIMERESQAKNSPIGASLVKKSRFTEPQIVGILKESETGAKTTDLCRSHGISPATFYKLKSKFGGMEVSDIAKMRTLEDENRRLEVARRFCA